MVTRIVGQYGHVRTRATKGRTVAALLGMLFAIIVLLAGPTGVARATSVSWSGATSLDRTGAGRSFADIACPSAHQCTAVDADGQEVTFDPTSPGTPTPISVGGAFSMPAAVACPSTGQCTFVGAGGEVTFDPTSPSTPDSVNRRLGPVPARRGVPLDP